MLHWCLNSRSLELLFKVSNNRHSLILQRSCIRSRTPKVLNVLWWTSKKELQHLHSNSKAVSSLQSIPVHHKAVSMHRRLCAKLLKSIVSCSEQWQVVLQTASSGSNILQLNAENISFSMARESPLLLQVEFWLISYTDTAITVCQ